MHPGGNGPLAMYTETSMCDNMLRRVRQSHSYTQSEAFTQHVCNVYIKGTAERGVVYVRLYACKDINDMCDGSHVLLLYPLCTSSVSAWPSRRTTCAILQHNSA